MKNLEGFPDRSIDRNAETERRYRNRLQQVEEAQEIGRPRPIPDRTIPNRTPDDTLQVGATRIAHPRCHSLCHFRFNGSKINAGVTSRAVLDENGVKFPNDF